MSFASMLKKFEGKWVNLNGGSTSYIVEVKENEDVVVTAKKMGAEYLVFTPISKIDNFFVTKEDSAEIFTYYRNIPWNDL